MHLSARVIAVTLVGIAAAAAFALIARPDPVYTESALVLFTVPGHASATAYTWQSGSLISTGSIVTDFMSSPEVRSRITGSKGAASYGLSLVNLYNDDYPDYGYPEAVLTASSPSGETTRHTFLIARRVLSNWLAGRQSQAGARPAMRVAALVLDDSGPVRASGSRSRSLAGLLVLALVSGGTVWSVMSRAGHHRQVRARTRG